MIPEFKLIGDTAVIARFETDIPEREHNALVKAMTKLGLRLLEYVQDTQLAGAVLKRRSGNLARAQNLVVTDTADNIGASVGFNKNEAIYGVFHEFGVPHEWLITAKRAKALRFTIGGEVIFRKSVVHPPLPERSFLRSSLAWLFPDIQPTIEAELKAVNG